MPVKSAPKPALKKAKKEKIAGKIDHYFDKIKVVTTKLKAPLKVGDMIHIKGHTTDFVQPVSSMQIEHVSVQKAKKGEGVGIRVKEFVRDNDIIYFADKKRTEAKKAGFDPIFSSKEIFQKNRVPQKPARAPKTDSPRFFNF